MKKYLITLLLLTITMVFCQYVFAESAILKAIISRINTKAKLTPTTAVCKQNCLIEIDGKLLPDQKPLTLIKNSDGVGEIVEIK